MSYELAFVESALKEWRKLAPDVREQFKSRLRERLEHPHVPSARLSQLPNCYKIKLRSLGYRMVYQVDGKLVLVTVIAVGRRDKGLVYLSAARRAKR